MSNKRITDLTELTNPTTDDVFPVVDIASNTTTKVQLGNLPVPTSVTTALATKENTITPGTTAQYFRGDKSFQTLDKTAVGLANVDNTSDANKPVSTAQQTALNAKQDTLVSGTNIKTLNSTSLLGSGNIVLTANPSGVSGAIQFSNGSAFASDAANLFWDDTNNRLGVGTNAPTATGHIVGSSNTATDYALKILNLRGQGIFSVANDGMTQIGDFTGQGYNSQISFLRPSGATRGTTITQGNSNLTIENLIGTGSAIFQNFPIQIVGRGSTSATTSLLVQNSSAFTSLKTLDNGEVLMYPSSTYPTDTSFRSYVIGGLAVVGLISDRLTVTGGGANDTYIQGYGTYLHYERFRGLVINNSSSASLSTTPSALVEIQSTTQGFLPPKMTTTQKNAIATPSSGLVVYDSTTNKLCCYNGSTWNDLF